MRVLIIGSGGREHALTWKIRQSKKVDKIFCAPGNPGMGQIAKLVNLKADNIKGLADFAARNKIGLTVVGPEQPLAKGIVDEFQRRKLKVFGPEKKAARLESSKVFAKQFMHKYHIPTASFKVFDGLAEAIGFCKGVEFPAVIKVDGLAAGKGVIVVRNFEDAERAIEEIFQDRRFGDAGSRIIVESFLTGQEVSIMAITDGKTIIPFLPSQDHKQAFDGDKGPNTGGMGAFCPVQFLSREMLEQVREQILQPVVTGLRNENINYRGVIYAGLMITDQGPKVLEFNCRFGDPETQAVLPLLKSDIVELLRATADRRLANLKKLEWRRGAAVCVIMASKGYPGKYQSGQKINGLQGIREEGCYIFHAGTKRNGNQWLTAGGRVLGVMGSGDNLQKALDKTYKLVKRIKFPGAHFRSDIGSRVVDKKKAEREHA